MKVVTGNVYIHLQHVGSSSVSNLRRAMESKHILVGARAIKSEPECTNYDREIVLRRQNDEIVLSKAISNVRKLR